ncbi:MAG: hypothetical protein C4541_04040 [Candidatus Auribacter fodinae]|uniref:Uncharacterized protein n=1 Tax=Candidatus Auribacter fodinae TaxID=2093366 RepID=A0A3A4R2S4_9BACT|nr:MAG: hypothetical protein C4541_04040 [Candidatus Auribacter fodinae]
MIKKAIYRILINFIPAILFCTFMQFVLYYVGPFNEMGHVIFFVIASVIWLLPVTTLSLVIYALIVKGEYTKKNILWEFLMYFLIYVAIHLIRIYFLI